MRLRSRARRKQGLPAAWARQLLFFVLSSEMVEAKNEEEKLACRSSRKALLATSFGPEVPSSGLLIVQKSLHAALPFLIRDDHGSLIA